MDTVATRGTALRCGSSRLFTRPTGSSTDLPLALALDGACSGLDGACGGLDAYVGLAAMAANPLSCPTNAISGISPSPSLPYDLSPSPSPSPEAEAEAEAEDVGRRIGCNNGVPVVGRNSESQSSEAIGSRGGETLIEKLSFRRSCSLACSLR